MYAIPLSLIAVLVFAAIAAAQSGLQGQQDGQEPSQNPATGRTTDVQNSTTLPAKKEPAETTTPAKSTAPATDTTVAVDINDLGFAPPQLNIAPGTRVMFVNNGEEAHTATADNEVFDTGELERGESTWVFFRGSGTVTYHDQLHPEMKGSIVVGERAGGEAAAPQQSVSKEAPTGNDGNGDSGQTKTATDSSSPIQVNDSEPSSEADQPAPKAAKNLKG
jgi:plastocyanin